MPVDVRPGEVPQDQGDRQTPAVAGPRGDLPTLTVVSKGKVAIGNISLVLAASLVLMPPSAVHAQCSSSFIQWVQQAAFGPASIPVNDTGLVVPERSRAYFTQGTQMFTIYNENYPQGCTPGTGNPCSPTGGSCTRLKGCKLVWSPTPAGSLEGAPVLVPHTPFELYAFLASRNGLLYKLDVTGETYPMSLVDTRRPSCLNDRLLASPAAQLYSFSNSAFKNDVDSHPGHESDDLVVVVTSAGCGDSSRNRIIAYWASDLTKKWEFNAPTIPGVEETGSVRLGGGPGGCAIDYANNRIYCGTDAPAGTAQDSLWALDTITGRLIWSDNPGGGLVNRPALNNNRLYVASRSGSLQAYDAAGNGLGGPSRVWTTGLSVASPGAIITRSPQVETRPGSWQGKILVLDSLGTLFAIQDNGTTGSILWSIKPTDSGRWISTPAVLPGPSESKAFIGRNDGYLQMIKLDGGQPQGIIQVAASTVDDVYDPAIDFDFSLNPRVVVVGGTRVSRIAVPICTEDPAPGMTSCFDECLLPAGNPPNWNPNCVDPDTSCRSYSCRDPGSNPQYNPCHSLASPTSACIANLDCFGGVGCTFQGDVPDGVSCDDGWPGAPGEPYAQGTDTCRSDAIPSLVACSLPEGSDCDGLGRPRHKCVTKLAVCGGVGGGKCCVCNDGYGMNCNDRCYKGQCVSDVYAGCAGAQDAPCISAGDRACGVNQTCCGSSPGSICTSDSECTASPQGRCLDLDPLDGNPTRQCYYQQCVNLSSDAQHCGACGNDCGMYAISTSTCADDLDCGTCTKESHCAGLDSKCVDGSCGQCRADTTAVGQPLCGSPCSNDALCGPGKCTNGFCCAAGRECVGGSCLPLVCHRLANRGTCEGGVCTTGAACDGPGPSELATAGPAGMSSLDFEFNLMPDGTSECRAFVTNYRTTPGATMAAIDQFGAVTSYGSTDPARLHGVAVSPDGSNIFAAMVNNGGGTPGLALSPPGSSVYGRILTSAPTGGLPDNPFAQLEFNKGPVGPAFDETTFSAGNLLSRKAWVGNWVGGSCVDRGLCRIDFGPSSWIATAEPYCNQPCVDPDGRCEYSSGCPGSPERITSIAFGQRMVEPNRIHRYVTLAHGTTLSFVDLDGGVPRQSDVNLASVAVRRPDAARGESTVQAVLSIAPAPYGDVIVEVRGAGDGTDGVKNRYLLNVSAHDRSCRHELDVQRGLKHVNPCGASDSCQAGFACVDRACMKTCGPCPPGFSCLGGFCRLNGEVPPNFGTQDGRLAVMPSGKLFRWVAAVDQPPAQAAEYDITPSAPSAGSGCDDQNACTIDTFDPPTVQCLHAPVNCDDGIACTADSCVAALGCLHAPLTLTEPGPADFVSSNSLQWPPTGDASHWNTYRGTIPSTLLAGVYNHVCFESGDAFGDGPTVSNDTASPSLGTAFYYLVSGEAGCESDIGHDSSGRSIPNALPCPTPP